MHMINVDARHLLKVEQEKRFNRGVKKFALTVALLSVAMIATTLVVQHLCAQAPFWGL